MTTNTTTRNLKNIDWENGPDRKLANNTYRVTVDGMPAVRLHLTDIIKKVSDSEYVLNSGGYRTHTTKQRLNALLPIAWTLYQHDFQWMLLIRNPEREGMYRDFPFYDGIVINNETRMAK